MASGALLSSTAHLGRRATEEHIVETSESQRLCQQYRGEANRVQQILELSGASLACLSSDARLGAALVANLCSTLHLADPDLAAAMAAWAQLHKQDSKETVLQAKLERCAAAMRQDVEEAAAYVRQLQQCLASEQAQQPGRASRMAKEQRNIAELQAKEKEYQRQERHCMKALRSCHATPEIKHSSLVEKQQQVAALEEQLAELQEKVGQYQGLPASVLGAKLALEEARRRLQEMEFKLEGFVNTLEDGDR